MSQVTRFTTQFTPKHYGLSLDIRREERIFSGLVTINGALAVDSGALSVHSKDLEIESVLIDGKAAKFNAENNDEIAIVHPDLKTGDHVVVIAFSGKITDTMHGMYPCYFEHEGKQKELIATQFESHHAREVFPCIDEPEAKATFDVTLTTEDTTVLGNMPVKEQRHENGRLVTTFETTPRMSTYLLAWVIGELHKKTSSTSRGVEVNVWATPAQSSAVLDFALEHAVKTIEFFDEYFEVPYPLPKSDHVALPDFTAGAMENWGLITYREVALLAHPKTSSISSKQYVARVIAHELSHQWFGNLVTMKWWDDLWLNESFATLMEYVALDGLYPEWNAWLEMSNFRNVLALRRDAIDGVQAVRTEVNHPDEISTLFDSAIVYAKGARLLRMLQHYVGDAAFRQGLGQYFKRHAYQNTEADDLWQAIEEASGKNISSLMNVWLSQPGYPVVSVRLDHGQITLTQKRFFIGPHGTSDRLWPIPLNAPEMPELLDTRTITVPVPANLPPHLNVGNTAHFITNYSEPLLQQLLQQIDDLPALDRLQLLQEQTLLARGGEASAARLIPTLEAYRSEANQAVWEVINLTLSELKPFVEGDETSESKLKQLAAMLGQAQYQRLGWLPAPGETEEDTKLRSSVIAAMLYGEDNDAIAQAARIYQSTLLDDLEPELRPLIIGAVLRQGKDKSIFMDLVEKYRTSPVADTREDIILGLAQTKDTDQIKQLLALISDGQTVRPQDVVHWVAYIIKGRYGRTLAWQWMRDNWGWIQKTFSGDKSFDLFPRLAGSVLRTKEEYDQYKAFFEPMRNEPALARVIAMGVSDIEGRIELLARDTEAVRKALNQL